MLRHTISCLVSKISGLFRYVRHVEAEDGKAGDFQWVSSKGHMRGRGSLWTLTIYSMEYLGCAEDLHEIRSK